MAILSALWQRHCMRQDVARAIRATLESFLMKLSVALLAALTLRFVEPAGTALDWQAFLLAYTGAALLALLLATFETSRALKESLL